MSRYNREGQDPAMELMRKRYTDPARCRSQQGRAKSRFADCVLWCGFMLSPFVHASDDHRPVPPYENVYTEKRGGRFPYDIHAWVYPHSSATRFQMPDEWADDALEGTLALAYRVEWLTGQTCGYAEAPECRHRVRCVLDAYFDQPSNLPFRNLLEVNHDTFGGESSAHWLTPQSEAEFKAMQALRRSVTLAGPVRLVYRTDAGTIETIAINTFQYERRMYNLDQVSFQIPCTFPDQLDALEPPVRLVIGTETATDAAIDTVLRRLEASDDLEVASENAVVHRIITIPAGFFARWHAHHDEYMAWEPGYHDTIADAPWLSGPAFEPTDYEARFGSAAAGVHDRDIHIWTYTKDFADRFGMPEEWIAEESLGDAQALAFRVERDVAGICGAGFDLKNCRRFERCMWDIYLPEDAPLPWYVDWPVSNFGGGRESSIRFLQENDRTKLEAAKEVQHLAKYIYGGDPKADHRVPTAMIVWQQQQKRPKKVLGFEYWSDWEWFGGSGPSVRTHDKRIDGLQLVSVLGQCVSRRSWEGRMARRTYDSRDHRLLFTPRGIDRPAYWSALKERRIEKPEILVEVKVPLEFEYRWLEHQTKVFRSDKRIEGMLGTAESTQ